MATALNTTVEYLITGKEDETGFDDFLRVIGSDDEQMNPEPK